MPKPRSDNLAVNEYEGSVLGLIARRQPISRYQILKSFQMSPTKSINGSKGSLYPLVRRLVQRGLLALGADSRAHAEQLVLTASGYAALQRWTDAIELDHLLVHDPLQIRVLSLGELPRPARIKWVARAKALLREKERELAEFGRLTSVPYQTVVHDAAVAALAAKSQWLDRLLDEIESESKPQKRSKVAWDPIDPLRPLEGAPQSPRQQRRNKRGVE